MIFILIINLQALATQPISFKMETTIDSFMTPKRQRSNNTNPPSIKKQRKDSMKEREVKELIVRRRVIPCNLDQGIVGKCGSLTIYFN